MTDCHFPLLSPALPIGTANNRIVRHPTPDRSLMGCASPILATIVSGIKSQLLDRGAKNQEFENGGQGSPKKFLLVKDRFAYTKVRVESGDERARMLRTYVRGVKRCR